jgi:hypothetical protein
MKAIIWATERRRPTCPGRRSTAIRDYIEIQTKQGVKVYKTPDSILEADQLFDRSWRRVGR